MEDRSGGALGSPEAFGNGGMADFRQGAWHATLQPVRMPADQLNCGLCFINQGEPRTAPAEDEGIR